MLPVLAPSQRRWSASLGHGAMPGVMQARQSSNSASSQPNTIVILVVVGSTVFILALVTFLICKSRKSAKRGAYQQTAGGDGHLENGNSATDTRGQQGGSDNNNNPTVNRTTSIRSIMTLPVYKSRPSEGEQILGREGERDGVDVIVEHSTEAEEEAMREEEMEALYQIRMTARQERELRVERRDERARARAAGDTVALAEIRSRHANEREASALPELRLAHGQIKERRQRAVSSVSYHDLGVARADGSRLRANSSESERMGLLSDAASMGDRSASAQHTRGRSASSIISFDSATDVPSPGLPRSGATTPRLTPAYSGHSPDLDNAGPSAAGMFGQAPPNYDDVRLGDGESRLPTPTNQGPPPDYPETEYHRPHQGGPGTMPHVEDDSARRSSRGVGGVPQLPSLRIGRLPEIVVEPSTARPENSHP